MFLLYVFGSCNGTVFYSSFSAFGVDAAFSYKYNQRRGICNKDGLAICPGFTTTHVIPVGIHNLGILLRSKVEIVFPKAGDLYLFVSMSVFLSACNSFTMLQLLKVIK